MAPSFMCAGCGKALTKGRRELASFELHGLTVTLCPGRSYRYPSDACRRKAIQKLKVCPGCGDAGETEPGFICRACEEALATAAAHVPKDVAWYRIDARDWIPSTYGSEGWAVQHQLGLDSDADRDFVIALVDAWAQGRVTSHVHDLPWDERGKVERIVPVKRGAKYLSESATRVFQATPVQVAGIKAALGVGLRLLREQRLTGRQEGRSLLAGLASGELSPNAWDEKNKRTGDRVRRLGDLRGGVMKTSDRDTLGLTDAEMSSLTSFTWRFVLALAHLREAWLSADGSNGAAIEEAVGALSRGHSFEKNRAVFERVLTHGVDAGYERDILRKVQR